MGDRKRDKAKVGPLTGAEEEEIAQPLKSVPEDEKPNANSAVIPGTGKPVMDANGKEVKRVVQT